LEISNIKNIAIIGSGSWGTALVKILSTQSNHKIRWWFRDPEAVKQLKALKFNPKHLRDVRIPLSKVKPTSNIKKAIREADLIILAIPSAFVNEALENIDPSEFENKWFASAIKGMMPEFNLTVTEYLKKEFNISFNRQAIIAGPCHAEEVALEKQSYLTTASPNHELAEKIAELLSCHFISCKTNSDLLGVEYCSVMKNIVAMASGIVHAQNFGDNFQAVLVSNAVDEIHSFLDKVQPKERNLIDSAYLGDILVTAYSQFSRNRTLGTMVGRGYSVRSAMMEMNQIAEGYYGVNSIYKMGIELDINLPIVNFVYHVLYDKISPMIEVQILKELLS
jgi:glycerol-3-phosphate dehydrogenase (NAD(P)+)